MEELDGRYFTQRAPLDLSSQVAIVTGGGSGLGRAEAIALAARGAKVVICDIRAPEDTVAMIRAAGGEGLAVELDLAEPSSADALVETALTVYGDVHTLVNNAGIIRDAMCFNLSLEDWDAVLTLNLTVPFLLARACARWWRDAHKAGVREGRAIVNTSSESGLYGNVGQANYASAKAGLAGLTLTLAAELDQYGVRVNAIAPRARTGMSATAFGDLARDADYDPFAPEHVAAFVSWLVSSAATGVTGHVLVVHGGDVERMHGWEPIMTVERRAAWADDDLISLRDRLFPNGDGRAIASPIRELFVERS